MNTGNTMAMRFQGACHVKPLFNGVVVSCWRILDSHVIGVLKQLLDPFIGTRCK